MLCLLCHENGVYLIVTARDSQDIGCDRPAHMPHNIIEFVQQFRAPRIAWGIITGPDKDTTILGKDRLESGDGAGIRIGDILESGAILDLYRNRVGNLVQSRAMDLWGLHSFDDQFLAQHMCFIPLPQKHFKLVKRVSQISFLILVSGTDFVSMVNA